MSEQQQGLPEPVETPKKRPAFQFYPADWRKDVELRACSLAARGLWIDLMCVMHECEPYGHLVLNGAPMTPAKMAGQIGVPVATIAKLLAELLENGVARKAANGAIYSKRMVDDERVREIRAQAGRENGGKGAEFGALGAIHGSKGGRPRKATPGDLNGGSAPPNDPGQKPPQNPPPSSSSSSSASAGKGRGSRLPPDWDPGETGMAFAAQQGLANGRAHAELEKFRDHWSAATGQNASKADWQAAWRNWVRKAVEFGQKPGARGDDPFAGAH